MSSKNDRIVNAKTAHVKRPVKAVPGTHDLCSVCRKGIRVEKYNNLHRIITLKNPVQGAELHVVSLNGCICVTCLARHLLKIPGVEASM